MNERKCVITGRTDKMARMLAAVMFVLLNLFFVMPASAAMTAIQQVPDNASAAMGGGEFFTLGREFNVNSSIYVTVLGVTYRFADNKDQFADIGIFDLDQNMLASGTIVNGYDGTLLDNYCYVSVNPTLLESGKHYIIGSIFSGPNITFEDGATPAEYAANMVFSSYLTPMETTRFEYGTELTFPGNSYPSPSYINVGPNFMFTPASAVPIPAASWLLGAGLAGLLGFKKKYAGKAKTPMH